MMETIIRIVFYLILYDMKQQISVGFYYKNY